MPGNLVTIMDADGEMATVTGGKLDVNATVSGSGDGAIQDGVNAAIEATVFDGATANPLAVTLTDANGDAVAVGGGTQYTEDAAAAADPVGTALMMVRDDALSGQTSLDGDNVAARGTDKGELYVKHADTVVVDGSGVTQPVSGTVTANLSATDNAVLDQIELNTDPLLVVGGGVEATAIRVTIASDSTGVLSIDDNGGSITVDGSLTVDLGANNDVIVTSGTIDVIGTVADDATTPGDPVMVGGWAKSPDGTDPSAVAENDVARFITDLNRRLYVATNHPRTWRYHLNTSTAQTDTQIQAAPGAGLRVVITNIQFTSGAATAINLFLEESTTNIWGPIYLEAVAGRGYVSGPIFLPITANTAVTYTTSAAIAQAIDILGFIEAV